MQALYQKWREQRKIVARMDIFDPEIEPKLEAAHKTLLEILMKPIESRVDAYTVLYVIALCGTHERAIRRALLNVARFLHVMCFVGLWV